MSRLFVRGSRPVAMVVSGALVLAVVGAAPSVEAAPASNQGSAPTGTLSSASWRWLDKHPDGSKANYYGPLLNVELGQNGQSVWPAQWTSSKADGAISLRISGVPAGVTVSPAAVPGHLDSELRRAARNCTNTGGGAFECSVNSDLSGNSTKISPVLFTGSAKAPAGRHILTVALLRNGQPVNNSFDKPAETRVGLNISRKAKTDYFAGRSGQPLVAAQQPTLHKVYLYRLSGPKTQAGKLVLSNVVPKRLAAGVKVKAKGWTCSTSKCTANKAPAVGKSTKAVGLLWRLKNRDVAKWRKIPSAKAHQAAWWTSWSASDAGATNKGRFEQRASLTKFTAPKQPKYKNAAQALTGVRRAQLTTVVTRFGQARRGGIGKYSIQVSNGGSRQATSVQLQLKPPGHAKVKKVVANKGWRCQKTLCKWRGKLAKKKVLPPLKVVLKSNAAAKRATHKQRFAATVSWRAAHQRGVKKATGREKTAWLAPLTAKVSASNKVLHSHSGIKTVLTAKLGNRRDEQVRYRWRQACSTAAKKSRDPKLCPKVTWIDPLTGIVTTDSISNRFVPPVVRKQTSLWFEVQVTANGATTSSIVKIKAVPVKGTVSKWNPRKQSTTPPTPAEAAKILNNPSNPAAYKPLQTKPLVHARINQPGITHVLPASKVKLRIKLKKKLTGKTAIRKVVWRVNGKTPKKLKNGKVVQGGLGLDYQLRKRDKTASVVTARILHRDGRATVTQEVVIPDKVKRKKPKARALVVEPEVTLRASSQSFCSYFTSIEAGSSVTVSPLTLQVGSVTVSGSSCSAAGASISFTANDVQVGGATLSGITATMTSSALTVSAASISLPTANGSTPTIALSDSITASFSSSGLSSLSGTFSASGLSSLPYLALPSGWSIANASITLSTAGSFSLDIGATGPNEGQATLQGTVSSGNFSLSVSVANALSLTGYNGSTASFGGSGSISYSNNAVAYNIALSMTVGSGSTFQALQNVGISNASVSWSNTGFNLSGGVTVGIGSSQVAFTANAAITNASDWTATIATSVTPSVGSLQLASLTGTIGYQNSQVTFSVTASVALDAVSSFLNLDLTSASATIINACPTGDSTCSATQVRLELAVNGTFNLFSESIAVNTSVDVDLSTGQFDASFSLAGSNFGPAEAQLSQVTFFASNDGSSDPNLANNPCYATGSSGTTYGFSATATILSDVSFNVVGVYQGGSSSNPAGTGYCFSGSLSTDQLSQLSGMGLSASLNFIYSSYAATAGGNPIAADSPTMWASMSLPSQVQTFLGGAVDSFNVSIAVLTSGGSVTGFSLNGSVAMSAYISGGPDNLPSFELTSIGIGLQVNSGESSGVELSFDANGVLASPGSSDNSIAASNIDFDVTIGLNLSTGSGGGSLQLAANLSGSNGEVYNAFGVSGLNIGQLGISAQIGFDALINSSITISGSQIELPGNVSSALGMSAEAPISFSLTVGITAPCFDLAIGTPDQTTTAAIDWGGAGVLEAYYFHLLIAPLGNCTTSDGTAITGNFAVDFDGYIFGTEVDINGEIEITPDFSAQISATVGAFNVAGMDFNQTVINLNFAPSQGTFDLSFSGGANLWGAVTIAVSGTVDVNLGATNSSLNIQFDGSMQTNLFGIFTSDINVGYHCGCRHRRRHVLSEHLDNQRDRRCAGVVLHRDRNVGLRLLQRGCANPVRFSFGEPESLHHGLLRRAGVLVRSGPNR